MYDLCASLISIIKTERFYTLETLFNPFKFSYFTVEMILIFSKLNLNPDEFVGQYFGTDFIKMDFKFIDITIIA